MAYIEIRTSGDLTGQGMTFSESTPESSSDGSSYRAGERHAIVNALWDMFAKSRGKPWWRLIADFTPDECDTFSLDR